MTEEDGVSASDAFAALGNDNRVAIVRALAAADGPMAFSDLRDAVGMADSGQFNYHLRKLLGIFVRQVEPEEMAATTGSNTDETAPAPSSAGSDDGGYELTYAGENVVGAILAGTYTPGFEVELELTATCRDCGDPFLATYEDERVRIRCETCDVLLSAFGFPPGAFEGRDAEALTKTFERWMIDHGTFATDDICLNCAGIMDGHLVDDVDALEWSDYAAQFDCDRCGYSMTLSINTYLLTHPAVVAFYHDNGVDLEETTLWNLPYHRGGDVTEVSRDPLAVVSRFELGEELLSVTVESDLTVLEDRPG